MNEKLNNIEIEIPKQPEFYKIPARFGSVPIDEAPLGWEIETKPRETKVTKFEHSYPRILLPFQEVKRIEFGHNKEFLENNKKDQSLKELFPKGANRLFFGDNLYVMRQLPSKSIDLIYIDPPFFSGRNYNVIFGDKNEVRSFSDIWEGGIPGYLIWLNARLYEMKRLLKDTGNLILHLDWHAVHYAKVELDKIFGIDNFKNEIIWFADTGGRAKHFFPRKHYTLLWYSKGKNWYFDEKSIGLPRNECATCRTTLDKWNNLKKNIDSDGRVYRTIKSNGKIYKYYDDDPVLPTDVWSDLWLDINNLQQKDPERIGYPTQKPESLLQRIITALCPKDGVVADFFCGGGTTLVAAQELNRRWLGSDQSRIAVSVTSDRLVRCVEEKIGSLFPVPDFTVEHWGIYEIPNLENLSDAEFREFVVKAFGGKPENIFPNIHGLRAGVPLYVGEPSRRTKIIKDDVVKFSQAIFKDKKTNFGTMLAWNFSPDAKRAAEILAARENKRIDFVRLSLIRLESNDFREHIITKHKDYGSLLSFVQPPDVKIKIERIEKLKYKFDISDTVSLNKDGVIANLQWDFNFTEKFSSTEGYAFLRDKSTGKPILTVEYEFPKEGPYTIACSIQDDQGGEKTSVLELEVK
ncbi:MAG: hypothetical protein COS94_10255 [Candidatus Hydrogenedentes bacterium CG07_land_8_20_14_0_80_42_17]|nr:MAG: hypothetical protein COS94_10255 [Candidatus Hydrogenedentes bacterium CG07_land_8_20_14_0_80_42_17]